jgi:ABC-type dipeptide/oligopeptide/nickel transport system permease subunit
MIMLFSLGLMASGYTKSFAGIILLLIVFITSGIIEPLVSGYLHHRTESSCRATVESFQSLAERLAIIVVGLVFGYFSTNYSIFSGFRILGAVAFVYFIYYVFAKFKYIKE